MAYNAEAEADGPMICAQSARGYLEQSQKQLIQKQREVMVISEAVAFLERHSKAEIDAEIARLSDEIDKSFERANLAQQRMRVLRGW